jgi:hypothetical protein
MGTMWLSERIILSHLSSCFRCELRQGATSLRRKEVKMARSREKHESLVHQVEMKLKSKLAIGHSKHDDKMADKEKRKEKRKSGSRAKLTYEEVSL